MFSWHPQTTRHRRSFTTLCRKSQKTTAGWRTRGTLAECFRRITVTSVRTARIRPVPRRVTPTITCGSIGELTFQFVRGTLTLLQPRQRSGGEPLEHRFAARTALREEELSGAVGCGDLVPRVGPVKSLAAQRGYLVAHRGVGPVERDGWGDTDMFFGNDGELPILRSTFVRDPTRKVSDRGVGCALLCKLRQLEIVQAMHRRPIDEIAVSLGDVAGAPS